MRDWRVDTLRGYFLVTMTLGHFPNPLAPFTEYTFGYASSPDGFVFLSGLVSAWVYLSIAERRGTRAMMSSAFRRVGTIYATHMALVIVGILTVFRAGGGAAKAAHALQTLVSAALLSNQSGFDRILPMYCMFLAFTPIVLKQFTEGRAWLVGLASAALWTASQFGWGDTRLGEVTLAERHFNLLAWQAFFLAGQYFGFRSLNSEHPVLGKSRIVFFSGIAVVLVLMVDRHLALFGHTPFLHFSGHPDHNPARFVDAACLGYLLWRVPRSLDASLMGLSGFRFLNMLGRHSLQVFAFSMLITRFEAHTIAAWSAGTQLLIALLTILSLGIPAWLHQVYREYSTSRRAQFATS